MNDYVSIDEAFLKKVKEIIERNYADSSFGVEKLAQEAGVSSSQLYRRLHRLTGKAANQILREYRLQIAFELLQRQAGSISEIAYEVGFSSPSYFDACFKKHFGYQPGKVKSRHAASMIKKYFSSQNARYVSGATGFMVILVLMVFILSPGRDRVAVNPLDAKSSIAVLHFAYLSENPADQYLADAMMDEIILQLSYNQDLRVMPRISVEPYRSKEKNIKQIARELDVAYILDGSLQKQGDRVNVFVSLVHARTNRIEWKNKYPGNWSDILTIQSQIAQRIARELDIEITPEVKQIMQKNSTTSPDASDFYWRGYNEFNIYLGNLIHVTIAHENPQNIKALERAERLFHEALRMDSTYARAYMGLAQVYWSKHLWDTFLSEEFADSALILADKALSFDRQLAEAYVLRGSYYKMINNKERALKEYELAISLNPSSAKAYIEKAGLYAHIDLVNHIENFHMAALLDRGKNYPAILRTLAWDYTNAGFKDIAYSYVKYALELDDDSAAYYHAVSEIEHSFGDFKKAIELGKKSYALNSTEWVLFFLIGMNYSFLDDFEESFEWLMRYEEIQFKKGYTISIGTFWGTFRLAHAYRIHGFEDEASYYITEGLALYDKMLELDRHFVADIVSFYYMAAVYAFQGNKEKAYEYLYQLNNRQWMPLWTPLCLKYDPMFDSLRDDVEFQQIVRDVEAKYQAEHERVLRWMEENDMR